MTRELRDPACDKHLRLPGAEDCPGQRQPVPKVEHVGQCVAGRDIAGPPGQRDLAQTEVLHLWSALATDLDQSVAHRSRPDGVGALGRIVRVDRGPLGQHLQVTHLGQPALTHRSLRSSQQRRRIMTPECIEHVFDSRLCIQKWEGESPAVRCPARVISSTP